MSLREPGSGPRVISADFGWRMGLFILPLPTPVLTGSGSKGLATIAISALLRESYAGRPRDGRFIVSARYEVKRQTARLSAMDPKVSIRRATANDADAVATV